MQMHVVSLLKCKDRREVVGSGHKLDSVPCIRLPANYSRLFKRETSLSSSKDGLYPRDEGIEPFVD